MYEEGGGESPYVLKLHPPSLKNKSLLMLCTFPQGLGTFVLCEAKVCCKNIAINEKNYTYKYTLKTLPEEYF